MYSISQYGCFSYVIIGIMHNLLKYIKDRCNDMLESITIDRYLPSVRKLSFIFLCFSAAYIVFSNWYFSHMRFKIHQILLYPTIILFIELLYLLVTCSRIRNRLSYYFNSNIDGISPVYWA
jgi:hypothetical protein